MRTNRDMDLHVVNTRVLVFVRTFGFFFSFCFPSYSFLKKWFFLSSWHVPFFFFISFHFHSFEYLSILRLPLLICSFPFFFLVVSRVLIISDRTPLCHSQDNGIVSSVFEWSLLQLSGWFLVILLLCFVSFVAFASLWTGGVVDDSDDDSRYGAGWIPESEFQELTLCPNRGLVTGWGRKGVGSLTGKAGRNDDDGRDCCDGYPEQEQVHDRERDQGDDGGGEVQGSGEEESIAENTSAQLEEFLTSRRVLPCGKIVQRFVVTKLWVNGRASEDRDDLKEEVWTHCKKFCDDKLETSEVQDVEETVWSLFETDECGSQSTGACVNRDMRALGEMMKNKVNGPADFLVTEILQRLTMDTMFEYGRFYA